MAEIDCIGANLIKEDHFINSSVREKILEHALIGDSCVLETALGVA